MARLGGDEFVILLEQITEVDEAIRVVEREGVETEFQICRLEQLGCDAFQGYWIAPPLPADQVETLIQQQSHGPA